MTRPQIVNDTEIFNKIINEQFELSRDEKENTLLNYHFEGDLTFKFSQGMVTKIKQEKYTKVGRK
jgi:hypothetical protein